MRAAAVNRPRLRLVSPDSDESEPTACQVAVVDGWGIDLLIWPGPGRPPDLDAVWHHAGLWCALRVGAPVSSRATGESAGALG